MITAARVERQSRRGAGPARWSQLSRAVAETAKVAGRYRLSLYFLTTAVIVIAVATFVVNHLIGNITADNLVKLTEENTARDALHLRAMTAATQLVGGIFDSFGADDPAATAPEQPSAVTLAYLTQAMPAVYRQLAAGLDIVELSVVDPSGRVAWSSDAGAIGALSAGSDLVQQSLTEKVASRFVRAREIVDSNGVSRRIDVMDTCLSLQRTPLTDVAAILCLSRDMGSEIDLQVGRTKRAVMTTTIATMGGLLLVLGGFIVMADLSIFRAGRRELGLVESQLSERRQAQEELTQKAQELERSNGELEQFAYVASHDLQEQLRMISSYTQLLERRYGDKLDQDAKEYIGFAVDGSARMQDLIKGLLAYSRVGSRGGDTEPTDCNAVFDSAMLGLGAAIQESGSEVTTGPLPTVVVDGLQMAQLLQNLIGNAIKYRREEPPRIHISAEPAGDEWRFAVEDNGIGFESEYADQIFEIFQRLQTRWEAPGTGIGLAICKKIVERHGGRIWVESEPGKGSTFYFTIPKMEG